MPRTRRDQWVEVEAAKPWTPTRPGSELIGTYEGQRQRGSKYAEKYDIYLIRKSDSQDLLYVSGVIANSLFLASTLEIGDEIRIVFGGYKPCRSNDGEYKDYQLFQRPKEESRGR